MTTVHDIKGTGVSKARSFDLHGREDRTAVGDPPDPQRVACFGPLQPLPVWNSQCKQPPVLLPSRVRGQAGERHLRRHLWVLSETAGDPAAGTEDKERCSHTVCR